MLKIKWLDLQLFAGEGAGGSGDGGGEGAGNPGETAADPGRQRLLELNVPASKLRANRKYSVNSTRATDPAQEAKTQEPEQQAAAAEETEGSKEAPKRMTWDEIKADPEYNKEIQAVVQSRLRSAKAAEETLAKIMPSLEVLARQNNLDPANIDFDALNKAINDADSNYEAKALELGVPIDVAKRLDQKERDDARQQRTLEQQKIIEHIQSLEQQGEALKKVFPNFDLRTELRTNERFARMTSPRIGMSVEDAYYATHRKEIDAARNEVIAKETAKRISNAIQSGSSRPTENGASSQAPSNTTFSYATASREQREAFKRDLRARMARGEKVYPGR